MKEESFKNILDLIKEVKISFKINYHYESKTSKMVGDLINQIIFGIACNFIAFFMEINSTFYGCMAGSLI